MQLTVKTFDELSTTELYEILKARSAIFVVEQNCVYQDMDDQDYESLHMFYTEGKKVLAYLRAFYREESEGTAQIGRVLSIEHGIGLGGRLLKEGIQVVRERLNPRKIVIEAQCYAVGYYAREGFQVCSEEFLEDGIPHVQMELVLEE